MKFGIFLNFDFALLDVIVLTEPIPFLVEIFRPFPLSTQKR